MLQPPPARPGMREDEIDTPALLIDLDAFEFEPGSHGRIAGADQGEAAGARQDAQVAGDRQVADRTRRGRPVCAEGGGSRSAGVGRHSRHPGEQRGGRRLEAGAARGAGAHRQGRGVRGRCGAGSGDRDRGTGCRRSAAGAGGDRCRCRTLRRAARPRCGGAGKAHRRVEASDLRRACRRITAARSTGAR